MCTDWENDEDDDDFASEDDKEDIE